MALPVKCFFLCLSLLLGLQGTARAADPIGKVIATSGAVKATGPAGSRMIISGSALFEYDRVTVAAGNAQIILTDNTRIVVGPNSSLLIERYFMRKGSNHAKRLALKILRGTFRFISGNTPRSAISITTRHATIGIRGTAFDFWVRAKTGVVVLKGEVAMRGRRGGNAIAIADGCKMGAATPTVSSFLRGKEKRDSIRKNLPFLQDQTTLRPTFRLNTEACRLNEAN